MANSTTLYTLKDGRTAVDVTENKTLAIADQGIVQNVSVNGVVITLPAAVVNYAFTIRNKGAKAGGSIGSGSDGSVGITVTPNGTEYISGCGLTTDASDLVVNTKATSRTDDEISLIASVATGWIITEMRGIWAKTSV